MTTKAFPRYFIKSIFAIILVVLILSGLSWKISNRIQQNKTLDISRELRTIEVIIKDPDGNISFSLNINSNSNPCSILTDAKNQGKIKSIVIIHYGAPINSDYVKEINNYSDGWTFLLNGVSEPKGCSNYALKDKDRVDWEYSK